MSNSRKGITVKNSSWVQKITSLFTSKSVERSSKEVIEEEIETISYEDYVKRTQLSHICFTVRKPNFKTLKSNNDLEEPGCLVSC